MEALRTDGTTGEDTGDLVGLVARIEDLARRGEAELATILAIAGLAAEGPPGHRAVLLNDLGVLRQAAGDAEAALGCFEAAARLNPEDSTVAANLAATRAEVERRGPPRRWLRGVRTGPDNLERWVLAGLEAAEAAVGLRDRAVLEVGGALPEAAVRTTGARSWVSVDPAATPEESDDGGRVVIAGDAAALPLPDASVDVVFSSCAFEHLPDLPAALAEMRRVLRPGGAVFSRFSPTWASRDGHHLKVADPDDPLSFHDPVVPPWSHLVLDEGRLAAFLALGHGERAGRIAWEVFRSPRINRLFDADYRAAFAGSGMRVARLRPWGGVHRPPPLLRATLERLHPRAGRFDLSGYEVVLLRA